MTSTTGQTIACTVEGADKLPDGLGGEQGVCAAIAEAAIPAARKAGVAPAAVSVSVRVKSRSQISAVVTAAGRPRPEQTVASSDRVLNSAAIRMLARAVATSISS